MEQNIDAIPYVVHESMLARQERTIRRLWILCIVIFTALVITNACWIYYESQFEDVVTTVTQETPRGYNNYVGNDGDITNYGEADYQDENETP